MHFPKSRRGRVRLKLRPWMAAPLVVKDGDASIRLAADLPRFNWLEVKLNKKQEQTGPLSKVTCQPAKAVPFKIRVLDQTDFKETTAQINKSPPAQTMCSSSKWPLKKRIIRNQDGHPSEFNGIPAIKIEAPPANIPSTTTLPHFSNFADGMPSRGPVIVTHVMPPTPPASSAPAEAPFTDSSSVQDKPLDLSSKRSVPPSNIDPYHSIADQQEEDVNVDVEIISMTTRIRQPPVRNPSTAFHNGSYPSASSYSALSRSSSSIHPSLVQRSSSGSVGVGFRAVTEQSPQPKVLPNYRLHPYHWNAIPGGTVNSSGSFSPRYFHPQQIAGIKKPIAPLTPIPSVTAHSTTTHHGLIRSQNPIDRSPRCCVVCSRRAGFRCAGCHGKGYCSSFCQAVDWPKHSQLCQQSS